MEDDWKLYEINQHFGLTHGRSFIVQLQFFHTRGTFLIFYTVGLIITYFPTIISNKIMFFGLCMPKYICCLPVSQYLSSPCSSTFVSLFRSICCLFHKISYFPCWFRWYVLTIVNIDFCSRSTKEHRFLGVFSAFYGQRWVAEPGPTPSHWCILQ